jgi:hypothetical protein
MHERMFIAMWRVTGILPVALWGSGWDLSETFDESP